MRRQEARILGHAVHQLGGPDVVGLLHLLLDGRRDVDPFLAPLSDREAWSKLLVPGPHPRFLRAFTFKIIMFGIASAVSATSLAPICQFHGREVWVEAASREGGRDVRRAPWWSCGVNAVAVGETCRRKLESIVQSDPATGKECDSNGALNCVVTASA